MKMQQEFPEFAQFLIDSFAAQEEIWRSGITEEEAISNLLNRYYQDLKPVLDQMDVMVTQAQYDATVQVAYNIPAIITSTMNPSNFREFLFNQDVESAYYEIWTDANPFLNLSGQNAKRRKAERGLFKRICAPSDEDKYTTAINTYLNDPICYNLLTSGSCQPSPYTTHRIWARLGFRFRHRYDLFADS